MVVARVTVQKSKCTTECANQHVYVTDEPEEMAVGGNGVSEGDELFWILKATRLGVNCTRNVKQGGFTGTSALKVTEKTTIDTAANGNVLLVQGDDVIFVEHSNNSEWTLCYKFKTETSYSTFPNITVTVHKLTSVKDMTNAQQIIGPGGIYYVFQHFVWTTKIEGSSGVDTSKHAMM